MRRDLPVPASPTTLTTCARPSRIAANAAMSCASSASRPTSGAASPSAASPRADPGSASAPSTRCTTMGSVLPFAVTVPADSKAKECWASRYVASDTRMVPGSAADSSRAVVFTVSPVTA